MYLSSHIATTLSITFFSVEKPLRRENTGYEFLLVQQGSMVVREGAEKYVLGKGDVILLHPDIRYELELLSRNYVLSFLLDRDFLHSNLLTGSSLSCNSATGKKEDYQRLTSLLEEMCVCYGKSDQELALLSSLYELLFLLRQSYTILPEEKESGKLRSAVRAEELREFITANFHLPITMEELSQEFYLSPQYLSRIFREQFGEPFHRYLARIRMQHAIAELLGTEHTVTEIAFNNGFPNVSAFYKLFRESYGASPAAYRSAYRTTGDLASDLSTRLDALRPEERTQTEALSINMAEAVSSYAPWTDTINIGSLGNTLSHEFHRLFEAVQERVHFRYVRFSNLFSEEFMTELSVGVEEYSFSKLDRIFDLFSRTHALPFIELGMKPDKSSLSGLPENMTAFDAETFSQEEELKYLKAMLRHCINRYGFHAVSSWRFELWAKHDEELHFLETPEEYAERFRSFSNAVKELLPRASFGGPGFNTANPLSLYEEYVAALANAKLAPDFLSIYIYSYEPVGYSSLLSGREREIRALSSDPDFCLKTFRAYRKAGQSFFKDTPLYITEFNSGLNGFNMVAASTFQSAFLCRNMIALYKETDCIAYWYFADVVKGSSGQLRRLTADMGLLDRHGLPKPSLFAFQFFSRLKSNLFSAGTNHLAATNGRSIYQVLLVHYIHYNNNYCFTYHNRIGIANTYDVFEHDAPENITVTVTGVPAGRYRVTRFRLNREHGSLLDQFIEMIVSGNTTPAEAEYLMSNMQKEDVEYYAGTIVPEQEIRYLEYDGAEPLQREVTLLPHEVTLIQFERKL